MSTTLTQPTNPSLTRPHHPTPLRRFLGVVIDPQSYRNIGYLLLGLLLGTVWFTVLISGVAIGISMLVVALLGIPILVGLWYATRLFANVERTTANVLLGQHLAHHPVATNDRGNLWVRLRSMTGDRDRWRELTFLVLRFPVGIATFTVATTALAAPAMVAYAPIAARYRRRRALRRLGPQLHDAGCRGLTVGVVARAARRPAAPRLLPPPERPGQGLWTLDRSLARRRVRVVPSIRRRRARHLLGSQAIHAQWVTDRCNSCR